MGAGKLKEMRKKQQYREPSHGAYLRTNLFNYFFLKVRKAPFSLGSMVAESRAGACVRMAGRDTSTGDTVAAWGSLMGLPAQRGVPLRIRPRVLWSKREKRHQNGNLNHRPLLLLQKPSPLYGTTYILVQSSLSPPYC